MRDDFDGHILERLERTRKRRFQAEYQAVAELILVLGMIDPHLVHDAIAECLDS
jgi:hypothetical protein